MTDNPHRLPRTARPTRYDLVLEPDLDAATFRGTVEIAVDVLEPVAELVLNAAELVIRSASVVFFVSMMCCVLPSPSSKQAALP